MIPAWILAASIAALLPGRAIAQPSPRPHAVQPERPTVATHAGTVAPGWLEIEAGAELDRYADASHGGLAPVLFKLSLAPGLQLNTQAFVIRSPDEAW